jgi:hypothetical protein
MKLVLITEMEIEVDAETYESTLTEAKRKLFPEFKWESESFTLTTPSGKVLKLKKIDYV